MLYLPLLLKMNPLPCLSLPPGSPVLQSPMPLTLGFWGTTAKAGCQRRINPDLCEHCHQDPGGKTPFASYISETYVKIFSGKAHAGTEPRTLHSVIRLAGNPKKYGDIRRSQNPKPGQGEGKRKDCPPLKNHPSL